MVKQTSMTKILFCPWQNLLPLRWSMEHKCQNAKCVIIYSWINKSVHQSSIHIGQDYQYGNHSLVIRNIPLIDSKMYPQADQRRVLIDLSFIQQIFEGKKS